MSGMTYCPESFVGMVRVQPVATFVTVTFTFGITAPDGSVTVPTMVAFCANETHGITNNNKNSSERYVRLLCLSTPSVTPCNFETTTCIFSPPCQIGTFRETLYVT